MIALALADFAAEQPIGQRGVAEDQRQQDDRANQHEELARRRGGRVPIVSVGGTI